MASFFISEQVAPAEPNTTPQSMKMGARPTEVAPPSRFAQPKPSLKRWFSQCWRWIWDLDEAPPMLQPINEVRQIRAEFHATLLEIQSPQAYQVKHQIEAARSLRELWHLRADVFKVIADHSGEMEAQTRLNRLNRHFAVRPARTGSESQRSGKVTTW